MSWEVVNPVGIKPQLDQFASETFFAFTDALSRSLMTDASTRQFPDLMALGYWLRKSNMKAIVGRYQHHLIRPLGHVFHAAPGNVDSLFVYSGILSLMSGNINTIRLSSKTQGSAELLCQHVADIAPEHPEASARFCLVKCERDEPKLRELQTRVDGRVLWGSNEGIKALKRIETPAHCRDVVFAHKLSFAVIGIDALLRVDKPTLDQLVADFCRDNLTFAQQACSSAKVIVWQGNNQNLNGAKEKFWNAFQTFYFSQAGQDKYGLSESERYQALNNVQDLAMQGWVSSQQSDSGVLRVEADWMHDALEEAHKGAGLFIETQVEKLNDLNASLRPYHQTISYWGVDGVDDWLKQCLQGVDRVVPIGQALDFDVVWDGVDLVMALGRKS